MSKNTLWFIIVIIVGALIGSFLGKFIGLVAPDSGVKDLFGTEISAGISPMSLDLSILVLTFGCLFKFNITAVIGIITAAIVFRRFLK